MRVRIRRTNLFLIACVLALALPGTASAFTVTASEPTVTEGNTGETEVEFTVACELLDAGPLVATAKPGTAPAATAGDDFGEASPLVPCAGLPLSQTVTVPVVGDTADELNENFVLE